MTDRRNNPAPLAECGTHLIVYDQVHEALPVPDLRILQSVIFLRKRSQRLAQKLDRLRVYRDLAGLRLKYKSGNADNIADIILFEFFIAVFPDVVPLQINLNIISPDAACHRVYPY